MTTFASLGLGSLSTDKKLETIGQLWEDLFASVPPGGLLTDQQRTELERRAAEAIARPNDSVAWEEALAATRRRLAK